MLLENGRVCWRGRAELWCSASICEQNLRAEWTPPRSLRPSASQMDLHRPGFTSSEWRQTKRGGTSFSSAGFHTPPLSHWVQEKNRRPDSVHWGTERASEVGPKTKNRSEWPSARRTKNPLNANKVISCECSRQNSTATLRQIGRKAVQSNSIKNV